MKKSILPITLAAVLALSSTALASDFSDISGHWAEETIEKWADKDIISGYPDGTFLPDNTVTRAEFAKIITNAFDLENTNENTLTENPYDDVDEDAWYWQYVSCAASYIPVYPLPVTYESNIPYIDNHDDASNGFLPDTPVLRAHAAETLSEIKIERDSLEITMPTISEIQQDLLDTFADADFEELFGGMHGVPDNVSRMFEYAWLANELGIMEGDADGYFLPYGQLTRAELVTLVDRMIEE
ncbi:MAG: S-layer homology domain-containing protein, partial [Firmicutes bacterium]|nr:S-layer homology domain-containing protein [Bacillota bacterium]